MNKSSWKVIAEAAAAIESFTEDSSPDDQQRSPGTPQLLRTLPETRHVEAAVNQFDAAGELLSFAGERKFATVLADPPWRFFNRTGKVAPEHRRLSRYGTLTLAEIAAVPVPQILMPTAHLYLARQARKKR